MCGILGYVGPREAAGVLLDGLSRLEYRGYDSAGLAVAHRRKVTVRRTAGRVEDLRALLGEAPPPGRSGVAHTRWATHGEPSEANAHPHTDASGRVAIVHNGIVENAEALRAGLTARGVVLRSDTDSEALAHLVGEALQGGAATLADAVRTALAGVEGTYGLAVLDARTPDEIVVARNGSPIVLGIGDGEMVVASDLAAVVRHTQKVVFLDDGEIVTVRADGIEGSTRISPTTVDTGSEDYALGGLPDFLAKEIAEQPDAVRRALAGRLDTRFATARLGGLGMDPRELRGVRRVLFLGCGSAYYAGEIGAGLVEQLARIPAAAEPAGEFRHRNPVVDPDCLYVAVSQSGETADTLAAVQELRRKGGRVIGAVNVIGSAISRECGAGVFLHSGPEVSVASTKAVTTMSVTFAMLAAAGPGAGPLGGRRAAAARRAGRAAPATSRPSSPRTPPTARSPRSHSGGRTRRRFLRRTHPGQPGRAGGCAEAQGDLLLPRRGLPRLRAQARPAGTGHTGHAQRRRGARRRAAREERRHDRADPGPGRAGDRGDRRRAARRARRRRAAGPAHRAGAGPDPALDPAAAAGPAHRRRARTRRGPAAEPREVGDGGVKVLGLHVAAERGGPMHDVEAVEVLAGSGVVGDRYFGTRHRHVSVQSRDELDAAAAELGAPVPSGRTGAPSPSTTAPSRRHPGPGYGSAGSSWRWCAGPRPAG